MAHPFGERDLVEQTASKEPMTLDSFGGRIHVRWSPDEAVTPLGQLPFFIDFLKQANLLEPYVEECPLQFSRVWILHGGCHIFSRTVITG